MYVYTSLLVLIDIFKNFFHKVKQSEQHKNIT